MLKRVRYSVSNSVMQALLTGVLAVVFVAVAGAAPGRSPKISPELQNLPATALVDVIVQFDRVPGNGELARVINQGGKVKRALRHIPAAVFQIPAPALSAIAAAPEVVWISPDRQVAGALEFAGPAVGADLAFNYGWTGNGVGIAILDSGIAAEHPDVRGRVVYSESFVPADARTDDPFGHGTHVAVVAAGDASASSGPSFNITFRGVAPRAHLINLRVLDASGGGSDSGVIAAIDRAIALRGLYNIRVLNLSLGRPIRESYTIDPLCRAVERAWRAGLVVIVSAGNNGRDTSMGTGGYGTVSSPANSPFVITVGAMKHMGTAVRGDDLMASYSAKGPTLLDQIVKPDIVAPGNLMVSGMTADAGLRNVYPENVISVTYYKVSSTTNTSSSYFRLSGTSMAAPMVAGAAALLLQKFPNLTPDQVKAKLMKTATKTFPSMSTSTDPATGAVYTVTYDLFTIGAGYLDIVAALNNEELSSGTALSPKAVYDPSNGTTSIVLAPGSVWNNAIIWGTAIVWGSNVIVQGDAIVWGTAIIWGTQQSQGFAIIWGTDAFLPGSNAFAAAVAIKGER